MSRIVRFSFVLLALTLVFAVGLVASAQGPAGSWASGIACINLDSDNDATIVLSFYPEGSGTSALDYDDVIPAGGSKNYFTPSTPPNIPTDFIGSAVVSSSAPVACNVNTQKQSSGTSSDPYRIGTSAGVDSAGTGTEVFVPQVLKEFGGWNAYIAVQNSSTTASDVTVSYSDRSGNAIPAADETVNIPGQSNHIFYQKANANLPNGDLYSASVDGGSADLAVAVNFYNSGAQFSSAQFHSYNGFTQGGNKLWVPRFVRNYYGYNSGMSVQNIGGGSTEVKITFTVQGVDYIYNSAPINSGAALFLYAPDISEISALDGLSVGQRTGSAVIEVTSGGPVVAIINEDNRSIGHGSTYNAFLDGTQTNSVFFAQVTSNAGGLFSGGFQFSNTTSNPTTCDIEYIGASAANETGVALPANGSNFRFAPNVANLPNGFNAGVTVSCGEPIVGINNLAVNSNSGRFGDSFTQSNGLNQ